VYKLLILAKILQIIVIFLNILNPIKFNKNKAVRRKPDGGGMEKNNNMKKKPGQNSSPYN
jgi:hypothetical protein